MTERRQRFEDAIAELERDIETWRAKIAETEPLIRALRERLQPVRKPRPAPKPKKKPPPKPAPKRAPAKAAAAPRATSESDEARRAKSRESMRRYRAKKAAAAAAVALPPPEPPEVVYRDGVKWLKDDAGNLSREHSREPEHPLTGTKPQAVIRRGNASRRCRCHDLK
jgi:hypothetical protein